MGLFEPLFREFGQGLLPVVLDASMSMEQQFLIMANFASSAPSFATRLSTHLPESPALLRPRTFKWRSNLVQVWENDDYDPRRIDDPEEGYLFYRFRIEVSPFERVSDGHQIGIARLLVEVLESLNAQPVVCADFEDDVQSSG